MKRTSEKLSYKERKRLRETTFCIPEKRKYPIPDKSHARNALARVSAFGTPEEKRRVRVCVCKKYPDLPTCKKLKK